MRRALMALAGLFLAAPAMAQTTPGFVRGQVPSAAQWNTLFAGKLDMSPVGNVVVPGSLTITGALTYGNISYTNFATAGKIDLTRTQTGLVNSTLGGLVGTQTLSGTITGSFAPMNILQHYETLQVAGGTAEGLFVQVTTQTGARGGRTALYSQQYINGITSNNGGQYVASGGETYVDASDVGGIGYGANFTAQIRNASNVGAGGAVGMELNVGLQSGVTAAYQTGLQVVQFGNSVAAGTGGYDSAYAIGQQPGAVGWDYAFRISGYALQIPIKTTGTIFGITSPGTIANGFTMNGVTITGNAWYSPGVRILGGAANLANLLTLSGGSTGTGTTAPTIYTQGSATDVDLRMNIQGAGNLVVLSNGGNNALFQFSGSTVSNGFLTFLPGIAASRPNQFLINGSANNLLLGGTTAGTGGLATAATSGFPMLPFVNAAPTGTPVNQAVGNAVVVNNNSNNLNIYIPGNGWYHVQLVAGAL